MENPGIKQDSLLTSHQVGSLLQVNPSSINNWVKDGHIQAFRTPGGHRRIRAGDLVRFLAQSGIPIPGALLGASRPRLLLVDDDDRQLNSWQRLLVPHSNQLEIEVVNNGIDALVKVGAFKPDLVLLDVFMPETNGIEVCRRLKRNPETQAIKIILMSGDPTHALETETLRAGADRFLPKPIDMSLILQDIGIPRDILVV